ncbi:MAG: bifunctional hydroxymethylpyrimidine kinase/phosphomethylpyrimidine kinase, partial [Pseudomonadota bacterium]
PRADVVTPNLAELAVLTGLPKATNRDEMEAAAGVLRAAGATAVFAKGGHLTASESPDLLLTEDSMLWYEGGRVVTRNTHGTGCSLAASMAAHLGHGRTLKAAAEAAKLYIAGAISRADMLEVGSGHGPVHHFHKLWSHM